MCLGTVIRSAVILSLFASPGVSADRPEVLTLEAYSNLVSSYQQGRYIETAGTLSLLPRKSFQNAVNLFKKQPLTDEQRMAAALLHSEAVLLSRREERQHLEAVRDYIAGIEDVSTRRDFGRNWFLAVSHRFRTSFRYVSALPLLKAGRKAFPDDIEFRMALAALWEVEGCFGRDRYLVRAEQEYRAILLIEADLVEAHLRLAKVLQLQDRMEEAIREIEWVLDHAEDARTELIAYILLGTIHNQRGELSREIESFRAAVEIDPLSQVAALALSHALHKKGDPVGSRQVIESLLLSKEPQLAEPDVWWRFNLASSDALDSLLDDMRADLHR